METILAELAEQQSFRIEENSGIGVVRRYAQRLSEALGFSEIAAGELAIIVTEATTNILKHAGSGELLLRPLRDARGNGIEVLAFDNGPGIADLAASMRDGISTVGTAGSGLGAMRRLAAEFDAYTATGKGSVFYLLVWADAIDRPRSPLLGVVSLPKPGQQTCGDGWAIAQQEQRAVLALADGLGHGPDAAAASRSVLGVLRDQAQLAPARLVDIAHQRSRSTRGAAVAFAVLHPIQQTLEFVGIGNIAASVNYAGQRRQLISHNGIVGHNMRKVQEILTEWPAGALLIMHSDGLSMQWDLAAYPGLSARHPALIAAVLYRDFSRGTDDVTVMVWRNPSIH